ncbi:MAG: FixH family protein [Frankiales bacterium]|nr:FixH family protein [Frankiales bacterium]
MTSIDLPRIPVTKSPKPLTGWKVLAILIAFFGTVATVNGIMVHYALSTFPGVEDDQAYEHGLHYNDDIAAAAHQNNLHWQADGRVVRGLEGKSKVTLTFRDAQGAPVTGLDLAGKLEFLPDGNRDMELSLSEGKPGEYWTEIKAEAGAWLLDVSASRQGETLYRSRNRLSIR